MGPSGAGKSTLLRTLAGLLRPTRGSVRIGDRVVDDARISVAPMHRGAVLLGQDARLFPHLSASQNVAFGLRSHGVGGREARIQARAWLDRVGLGALAERRPAALSGGQQQRVALARALAAAPRLLLLDEPLTSLDAETAADVRAVLAEQVAATRTTTVLVTHDVIDAVAVADDLAILEQGRIVQHDAVRRVLEAPASRFAAAIAGLVRLTGTQDGGVWTSDDGDVVLRPASQRDARGATPRASAAVFPPSAVAVRAPGDAVGAADHGSVDAWRARIVRIEATLGGVRIVTATRAGGQTVAAEVPIAQAAALAVAPGDEVELHVPRDAVRLVQR
ncbi:ABC transporter ATP-binding protein [Agrococcus sp. SGAir0287]|nr:ABC transporter ATP-binding protein [Agrococcus sp. SGAir0287]